MNVRLESLGPVTLVIPQGRLDFAAAAAFQAHIEQVLTGPLALPVAVIVDCASLSYVSSAGLRVFLLGARAAKRAGLAFAVCSLQPAVRDVFDLSGFNRMMTVCADRDVALAQTASGAA
jgi:anti-sigma B factor antagonist